MAFVEQLESKGAVIGEEAANVTHASTAYSEASEKKQSVSRK